MFIKSVITGGVREKIKFFQSFLPHIMKSRAEEFFAGAFSAAGGADGKERQFGGIGFSAAGEQFFVDTIDISEDLHGSSSIFGEIEGEESTDLPRPGRKGTAVCGIVSGKDDSLNFSVYDGDTGKSIVRQTAAEKYAGQTGGGLRAAELVVMPGFPDDFFQRLEVLIVIRS